MRTISCLSLNTLLLSALVLGCSGRPAAPPPIDTPMQRAQTPEPSSEATQLVERYQQAHPEAFRFTVGGDITEPKPISRPTPDWSGFNNVNIRPRVFIVIIDNLGNVQDPELLKGPDDAVAQRFIETLKHWRYSPATLHGEPVSIIYIVTLFLD